MPAAKKSFPFEPIGDRFSHYLMREENGSHWKQKNARQKNLPCQFQFHFSAPHFFALVQSFRISPEREVYKLCATIVCFNHLLSPSH
jgi:hypothetical protein